MADVEECYRAGQVTHAIYHSTFFWKSKKSQILELIQVPQFALLAIAEAAGDAQESNPEGHSANKYFFFNQKHPLSRLKY